MSKVKNKTFGTILSFELKKIIRNRFTVITLIILTGYSLMQGVFQAEQTGDYAARTRELRMAIDGREIDDELLAEMVAAADEYGVFWNETNCTYEDLAGWVRKVVDYGKPMSAYDSDTIYQARLSSIDEAMQMEILTEVEKEYWYDQEELVRKPLIWHSSDEAQGLIDIVLSIPLIMLFMITSRVQMYVNYSRTLILIFYVINIIVTTAYRYFIRRLIGIGANHEGNFCHACAVVVQVIHSESFHPVAVAGSTVLA